jgi:large subunit ribosomal protein LP2
VLSLLDHCERRKNFTNPQMKHIAAYLLLQTGGNASPSASDIKTLLETVGIEADQAQLDKLISELEGKDINEVSQ